jgi:hypothetical protein
MGENGSFMEREKGDIRANPLKFEGILEKNGGLPTPAPCRSAFHLVSPCFFLMFLLNTI